ncbi:OB-fold domain-containing protein [Alcaligenaceae bacterium]|nr:OB-fold domain-containing protein [Alcaligenaceae bacterium]
MIELNESNPFIHDPYVRAQPEAQAFWSAAAENRFLLKACRNCEKFHWYPRVICPLCGSSETEWRPASGDANLHTFSVIQRTEVPYVLAYVELAEGPIMMSNIVDCDVNHLRIGQPLKALFTRAPEGRRVPVFAPRDAI